MGKDYFYGGGPARVKGLPHVFDDHADQTAALMNNLFNIYYGGMHALDNATTSAVGTRIYRSLCDLQGKIQADLRDAASEKSMVNFKVPFTDIRVGGAGQSLYNVFQDLEEHNDVLKCDDWDGNYLIKAPPGVFAFQNQMIARGSDIAKSYAEFNAWRGKMEQWKQKQAWENLGTNLDYGGKVIEKVGPKLWASLGVSEKGAVSYNATTLKWWGYGATVKGFMDSYIAVQSSTNSRRQLIAEVVGFVVDKIPVFGTLYGGVIRALPNAMKYFEDYALRNARAVDFKF